jgi:transposase
MREQSPDDSTLSVIRGRLPEDVHQAIFQWVLNLARQKKLLDGRRVGVDSTTLEANAAMKSIVRKDSGDDWKQYMKTLMVEAGEISKGEPTDDDMREFDRKRRGKTVSNDDWASETDSDARIAKMKDGTTHLAYKPEHAVDLESNVILASEIYYEDDGDTKTIGNTNRAVSP